MRGEVGRRVVGDDAIQGHHHRGEVVGGDQAGAAGYGGLDVVEAVGDVVTGEPEGEGFEGGVVSNGDVAEGGGGIRQGIEDAVGEVRGWGEDKCHRKDNVWIFVGVSIGI